MSKAALLELADRVEKASEGSRELDAEIVVALDLRPDWCRDYGTEIYVDPRGAGPCGDVAVFINTTGGKRSRGHPSIGAYPNYTSSLDAAMTLVPEGAWWEIVQTCAPTSPMRNFGPRNGIFRARTAKQYGEHGAMAENDQPALALTAAALRARAQQESKDA